MAANDSSTMAKYFAGVEGGSTGSTLVLLDERGHLLATVKGGSTNPLLIGQDECFERIASMLSEASAQHTSSLSTKHTVNESGVGARTTASMQVVLGMCLSGCVTDEDGLELAKNFNHFYAMRQSSLSPLAGIVEVSSCVVACDTMGSLMASNCKSGVVLIAGTGSNSLVFTSGSSDKIVVSATCGGWGHLFGDEGSAYWIAWRAYKTLLDDNDNYNVSRYDTKRLRRVICRHFQLANESQIGLFYRINDKRKFASLSRELYTETRAQPDDAINCVFHEAGMLLARKVVALLPRVDKQVLDQGLNVVCVGSVFNGWDLLEPGFVGVLSSYLKNFRLLKLRRSSAYGAAKLAAKQSGLDMPLEETTELLYAFSATSDGYIANGRHVATLRVDATNQRRPTNKILLEHCANPAQLNQTDSEPACKPGEQRNPDRKLLSCTLI